jgi:hypothetical protein
VVVVACAVAAALGWYWQSPAAGAPENRTPAHSLGAAASPMSGAALQAGTSVPVSAAEASRRERLSQASQRLERAEQVYRSYRENTRFPPESRPLEEHPDQAQPFAPVLDEANLRDSAGKPVAGVRIRSSQDRVFVNGAEAVRFTLEAVDDEGRPVALLVRRSVATSVPDSKVLTTLVHADVPFTDDGTGADDLAGDGRYAAQLTPALQGFADRAGSIRVIVELVANGQQGGVVFDVVYVPDVAGAWTGVREALENGALNFYLQAQVRAAGRYVASARVQDANGAPLALLQFNDVAGPGPAEFKLSLAGLLVHEKSPVFPLRLVDVEAFLLKPDTFPDRSMMPRLAGVAHVSKRYAIENFSTQEWSGEQRERYLAEYLRDVLRAEDELTQLQR